jgi:hypothetical protein
MYCPAKGDLGVIIGQTGKADVDMQGPRKGGGSALQGPGSRSMKQEMKVIDGVEIREHDMHIDVHDDAPACQSHAASVHPPSALQRTACTPVVMPSAKSSSPFLCHPTQESIDLFVCLQVHSHQPCLPSKTWHIWGPLSGVSTRCRRA